MPLIVLNLTNAATGGDVESLLVSPARLPAVAAEAALPAEAIVATRADTALAALTPPNDVLSAATHEPVPLAPGGPSPLPLHRRLGRRGLRLLRPFFMPLLHRLQQRFASGVDRSDTALRSILLLEQQADLARRVENLTARTDVLLEANARRAAEQQTLLLLEANARCAAEQKAEMSRHFESLAARISMLALGAGAAERSERAIGQVLEATDRVEAASARLEADQKAELARHFEVLAARISALALGADATERSIGQVQEAVARVEDIIPMLNQAAELTAASAQYGSRLLQSRAIPLGEEVLARTLHGWLLLPAEDTRLLAAMVESGGALEPGTATVLQALLSPGDLAIDVGANVGTMALAMARAVGLGGRVVAIEPTPRLAALLRRTAVLNGMEKVIVVEACALGAEESVGMLSLGLTTGHNSLLPLADATTALEVPIRTLDALLPRGQRPAVVKIDVEGAELDTWKGMARVVAETADLAVVVEFGPSHLVRSGITIADWFGAFTVAGFTPWEIDEATGRIRPLRDSALEQVFSINILFLRHAPDRWPHLALVPS